MAQGRNSDTNAQAQLSLLRTLVMWALSDSEAIQTIIKDKYKQQRHNDDENQPLSVQPWGVDGDKRRYFLVQGLDDTSFRVYREGDRHKKSAHWYSVAGSIDEAKELAKKLEEVDGSQAARRFAVRITNAVPMFEATEEVRSSYRVCACELEANLSRRNAGVENIDRFVALRSQDLSLASPYMKAGRVVSERDTITTTTKPSFPMQLPHVAQRGIRNDLHRSTPVQLSQQVGAR